jgi:hypothetical protein
LVKKKLTKRYIYWRLPVYTDTYTTRAVHTDILTRLKRRFVGKFCGFSPPLTPCENVPSSAHTGSSPLQLTGGGDFLVKQQWWAVSPSMFMVALLRYNTVQSCTYARNLSEELTAFICSMIYEATRWYVCTRLHGAISQRTVLVTCIVRWSENRGEWWETEEYHGNTRDNLRAVSKPRCLVSYINW